VPTDAHGVDLITRGIRLFSHTQVQPRDRRATDVILLVLSLLGILVVAIVAEPEPGYSVALTALLVSLPDAMNGVWRFFADVLMVWSVMLFVLALVRTRRAIARDMAVSVLIAIVLWMLLGRAVTGA
jgi:hypothetical protein